MIHKKRSTAGRSFFVSCVKRGIGSSSGEKLE